MTVSTCPGCGAVGPVELGAPSEVTVGTVAVVLERQPVVACPERHGLAPSEVPGAAMDAVRAAIPRARSRLFRADACRSCGEVLTMPVRRTERVVSVEPPDAPVLTLRFDLPMTRCPGCSVDQVPSRSQEDLVVSVPALFAAAERPGR